MQWRRREMAAAHSVPSELMRKNASSGDSFCRRFSSGASAVAVMPSPTSENKKKYVLRESANVIVEKLRRGLLTREEFMILSSSCGI